MLYPAAAKRLILIDPAHFKGGIVAVFSALLFTENRDILSVFQSVALNYGCIVKHMTFGESVYNYACDTPFSAVFVDVSGMTRAFLCVLDGDLAKSFYFHPLWPIVLGIFIIFPLWKFRLLHLSDKWIDHGAFAIGILFLLCFIIRHVTHSPIVQIDFTKGVFHFFSYMNI